ncbi:MAG: NADP-dependent oxidoreductase [Rectinemataceae bacterium]|jgi:NADPH:quinone reductase-like Zn-dependent oxidoreductase
MEKDFRAIRFHEYGPSDRLVLDTIPRPDLKADEVLVEVHFAGVNPVDWKIRAGYLKDYMPVPLPYTLGIDFSGTIADIGSEVKNFQKGQAVFGIASGAYAEYAVAKAADIVSKPDNLSFELAATVPVGALTAWKALEDAGVKNGQTVVVQGAAGGVGLFAVQFARLKGAKVIGTASSNNAAFVKGLGAEKVVDYKKASLESEIKDADAVIDAVGGEALEKSYSLLKKGGTLVSVAGQVSEEKAKEHGIKALGSGRGPAELLKQIAEMLAKKSIRSEVGRIFPLAEAKAAQDLSQTGHGRGRILLQTKK